MSLWYEEKIIGLRNDKQKTREWRAQIRLRKAFEKRLAGQAKSLFQIEGHKVVEAIKGRDRVGAAHAAVREIDAHKSQWKSALKSNVRTTARTFGARVLSALKSTDHPGERKDDQSQIDFDAFLEQWIDGYVGKKIDGISEVTKRRVQEAIQEGFDAGDGIQTVADDIETAYEGFSISRAMTIARTETGTAANIGLNEAAKATGIPDLHKEWVAAKDNRTREDHANVDGQLVPMDEKFDVGGFQMNQPLDPDGPPEEVINCRCAMVFQRGGEGE